MSACVAFYKAPGGAIDHLVRWATRSSYSHCELVSIDRRTGLSASWRDRGVRVKPIDFRSGHWDLLNVRWADPVTAWTRAKSHVGAPYDLTGILLSHVLATSRERGGRWFCSELCAYALGFTDGHTLSPAGLYRSITIANTAYEIGKSARGNRHARFA